jgi:phosphoglycolate phosphatase-like HAD superfamily hydrolase
MATLIFDLDGTLLDVRRRHYAVYSHVLRELGQPPLPEAEYWRRRRDGEGTLSVVGDLPGDIVSRFQAAWIERIESRPYLALDRPYAEVRDVLTELRRNHRLVLVTLRRDAVALAWQLSEARLTPFFQDIVSPGYYTPTRKSELLPYWYPMSETWVIGDGEADIDLAADLGARCICVSDGVRSAEFLWERGTMAIASSLRDLPTLMSAYAPRGRLLRAAASQ